MSGYWRKETFAMVRSIGWGGGPSTNALQRALGFRCGRPPALPVGEVGPASGLAGLRLVLAESFSRRWDETPPIRGVRMSGGLGHRSDIDPHRMHRRLIRSGEAKDLPLGDLP